MSGVEIERDVRPHVTVLRLNNPETRNSLDDATRDSLLEHLEDLRDTDTRVVVLGAHGKVFASGADLGEMVARTPEQQRAYLSPPRMYEAIEGYPRPVVAAITGHAFGAGLELAMACDLRVAAQDAKLGSPEVRLGIIPGGGGTQRLPRLVGMTRAMEMVLTGEAVTGARAAEMGLVNRAVPADDVMDAALDLAASVARWSPVALQQAKRSVKNAWRLPLDEGVRREVDHFVSAFSSRDAKEGITAFLEKRDPEFKGE